MEQPQSHRHRAEQDAPVHDEPTSAAAEHVATRYEVQRVTTYVEYEGLATFDTLDEARAYADEVDADGGTFGAEVMYEVLETGAREDVVVYQTGA